MPRHRNSCHACSAHYSFQHDFEQSKQALPEQLLETPPAAAAQHSTHPQGCIIPVALAEGLNAQAASSAKHGPAAVDDLALCEALQASSVLGQTQRVEAVVAVESTNRQAGHMWAARSPALLLLCCSTVCSGQANHRATTSQAAAVPSAIKGTSDERLYARLPPSQQWPDTRHLPSSSNLPAQELCYCIYLPWQVIGQPCGGIRSWEPANIRLFELLLTG